ncbi:MAG: S-layer homology domain-containing protein [Bacillota bacterium]
MQGKIHKGLSVLLILTMLFSSLFTFSDIGFMYAEETPQWFVETFDNCGNTGTSYTTGHFEGNYGIRWDYIAARGNLDNYSIDGKGLMIRNASENGKIYAESIPGGIGSFSVDLKKAFTGTAERTVQLLINDIIVDTFTLAQYDPETFPVQQFVVTDINVSGDFKLELRHTNPLSAQITIDNIRWTSYTGNGETPPPNLTLTHNPVTTAWAGDDINIDFSVNNAIGTVTGHVYYKPVSDNDFTPISTTSSAIIPGDEVTENIEYYIVVEDQDERVARSPETGFHVISVMEKPELITIAEARSLSASTEVRVEGIITAILGSGQNVYIQDETAGIVIRLGSAALSTGLSEGDKIQAIGTIGSYAGLVQVNVANKIDLKTVEEGVGVPEAKLVTIDEITSNLQGQLLKVEGLEVVSIGAQTPNYNVVAKDSAENQIFLRVENTVDKTFFNVGQELTVTAPLGQYNADFQLMIRRASDLEELVDESKAAPVTATPEAGAVDAGTAVTLSTVTEGATIYYTIGEGEPQTEYTEPIIINIATIIKAKAVKEGLEDSEIRTFVYTVKQEGVLSILDVKKLPVNTEAEVQGVVTLVTHTNEAYIQDELAGLQVFISNIKNKVKPGDLIKARGKVSQYNGELQIVPNSLDDIDILSSDNPVPEPLEVTLQQLVQTQGRVTVSQALDNYAGNEKTITVRGVITDVLPNGVYAMQIADPTDPTKVLSVALPAEYREKFNPGNNPDAVGRMVLVTGQEKDYYGKPAIRRVDKYDPNTGITTYGKYHVGFDIEGMRVTTEPFKVIAKDNNGFTARQGDVEVYIFTLRASNYNHVETKIGDWYSATGIAAYYNRPQLKLVDGTDLKFEVPPGQQDPREPLVLDIKPGNFVSTYDRRPLISARLEKTEADIDYENVRLLLNGESKEYTLDIETGIITYQITEDLDYGEHDVAIVVPDVEERVKIFNWFFRVEKENPTYNFYYGIPHSHTGYSDGAGTPTAAFNHAKNNKLDFLFITDHSNWLDGVEEGGGYGFEYEAAANEYVEKFNPFTDEPSEWMKTRLEAEAFNRENLGTFLGVRGFEMTSSTWGHMNTTNSDTYVEAKKQIVSISQYYDWIVDVSSRPGANVYNAFNHPNWPDDSFNNLAYVPKLDRYINGIEVANGAPPYSYSRAEGHYWRSLDNGWRLGALNAQDNHAKNWGDPDTLTVVLAEALDVDSLINAMNARRSYSTETRTLQLTFKGNGYWMGSVLDVEIGEKINLEILAEDSKVPIEKLQLITNGGYILEEKVVGGANSAAWNLAVEATGGAQWFVVKVIHSNGAWGHSSPIFTTAGENDIKLTAINVDPNPTLPGFETNIEATVSNMGVRGIEGIQVKFYANTINENNLIDTVDLEGRLNPGASAVLSAKWLPEGYGEQRVFAVLTDIEGVTTVTEISMNVKVVKPIGKKILFDGAHNNADVPGTVVKIIEMLRLYGYEATINTQKFTPELLESVDILIINIPLNAANKFTTNEEDAIADWVKAGGSIMLAAKSNFNQDSTLLNSLMEKLGSSIRFNDDNIYEPEDSGKYTGGMVWSIVMDNLPPTESGLNANMEAIRIFSGCSLINAEGGPLVNDPATELEILLLANDTSYTANPGPNAYIYNLIGELNGGTIPVIAKEKVGNGRIIAAGRHFYSDFEIGNNVSNTALTLQAIDWLAGYDRIRSIADIRANANVGDVVTVRGTITAPTNHFFDVVYIQDETSGVAVYGSQTKDNLPLGTEIIATGKVTYFEGELELAYENYDYEVIYVGPVEKIEPLKVSTKDAMSPEVAGMLITTQGVITDYDPVDGNFRINDGSGSAFVQIDGYLNLGIERFKIGDNVSVTGVASHGSVGPRIRVRYPSDLKAVQQEPPEKVEIKSVEATNGQITITLNTAPAEAPDEKDFTATISINDGEAKELKLEHFYYDEDVTVTFTFTPVAATEEEQRVIVAVAYGDGTPWAAQPYTIEAGDRSQFNITTISKPSVNTPFRISIREAMDTHGNLLDGKVNVIIKHNEETLVNDIVTFNLGSGVIPVTISTKGEHRLEVFIDGITAPKSVSVLVVPMVEIQLAEEDYDKEGRVTVELGDIVEDTNVEIMYAFGEGETRVELSIVITVPTGSGLLSISNVVLTNNSLVMNLSVDGLNERKVFLKLPKPIDIPSDRVGAFHRKGDVWEFRIANVIGDEVEGYEVEFETDLSAIALAEIVDVPASIEASVSNRNRVTLSWDVVHGAAYELIRKVSNSGAVKIIPIEDTEYVDIAGYNTTYQYQVRAVKEGYHSDLSPAVEVTTGSAPSSSSKSSKPIVDEEEPVEEIKVHLTDIAGHWAEGYIKELVALGAIDGYSDGTFRPNNNITRAEFVKIVVGAFNLQAKGEKTFKDTEGHWARDYIATAHAHGIINGYNDNTFGAEDFITREQVVLIISRAAELTTVKYEKRFIDDEKISSWARDAVYIAATNGIVDGYLDNTFRPQGNATRAEAVKIIVESLKK